MAMSVPGNSLEPATSSGPIFEKDDSIDGVGREEERALERVLAECLKSGAYIRTNTFVVVRSTWPCRWERIDYRSKLSAKSKAYRGLGSYSMFNHVH